MNEEKVRYAKFRMYRRIEKGIMPLESIFLGAFLGVGIWAMTSSIIIGSFIGFVVCLVEYRVKRNSFKRGD